MSIPDCNINPKTGKPFSRHSYRVEVSVNGFYYRGAYGDMKPAGFIVKRKCERCGFRAKDGKY